MNSENIISVRNLTKQFGDFKAVDNISFDVAKGEIFGFLGANGAGKTTAIRVLCGLSYATSGSGHVAGCDIIDQPEEIKRNIGYMCQKFLYLIFHFFRRMDFIVQPNESHHHLDGRFLCLQRIQ